MKKYLPLLIATVFFFSTHRDAHAQISLVVSPPRYDEAVDPGAVIQKTVKVTNNSDTAVNLKIDVYDFIVEDDQGTPVKVNEKVSGRYLASPWFTLDKTSFTLPPKKTELVYAIISVPADALPGGHYAGIYFSPVDVKTPAQTSGAGVVPQIGALFSITINGDLSYSALIQDFAVKQSLYEYGPVDFTAVIENQSDTHITPQTSITIKDMLGRTLATLTPDPINIFPFKSRTLTATWDQIWGLGRYTARLSVPYGDGQVAERLISFWIMPWKLIAAVLIVLMVILATYISVKRHLKHRSDLRDNEIDELKHRIAELENNKR